MKIRNISPNDRYQSVGFDSGRFAFPFRSLLTMLGNVYADIFNTRYAILAVGTTTYVVKTFHCRNSNLTGVYEVSIDRFYARIADRTYHLVPSESEVTIVR